MKILTLDIETSPHKGWAFNVWQNNMAPGQIIEATYMMSWAAKWYGGKKRDTMYREFRDPLMISDLYDLIDDADLIIGFNHDKFDLRHIAREFVEDGYGPSRPVATVDLLKVVKQRFNFPHNRLDYVAPRILGDKFRKLDTGGFDLWPAFIDGDPKAMALMQRYNKQDVYMTEALYTKLRPWVKNHPYIGTGTHTDIGDRVQAYTCPVCGTPDALKLRPRYTRCFAIRVVRCRSTKCGAYFDGKRSKVQ